jgi:valyl-tRNA synthetase
VRHCCAHSFLVTPAHDFNDFQCGKRNSLELINILNKDGTLNANAGPYQGKKRFEARELVIADLKKLGLYKGTKPNKMSIATCSRSKDIIEPYLIPQWYVRCKEMADAGIQVHLFSISIGFLTLSPGFLGCQRRILRDHSSFSKGHVVPMARQHPRLVHFPSIVVGSSMSCLPCH